MKNTIIQVSFIVLISFFLGFGSNIMNPNGIKITSKRPLKESAADSLFDFFQDQSLEEPVVINKSQLIKLRNQNALVLIDARLPREYQDGHIPGAINIPFELIGSYLENLENLPKEKWIVTYCEGPPCDKAELLALEVFNMEFDKVAYYEAGLDDWLISEELQR